MTSGSRTRASRARSPRTPSWRRSARSSGSACRASARSSTRSRRAARSAGVVPIENSVHGTVRENYDLLLEHDLELRAEVVVPVRLCLAALPGERLDDIERVYSHIQALGQAEAFLRTRPWALLTTYNTAGAGRLIVDRAERGSAAVLSPRAAGPVRARDPGRRDPGRRRQPDPVPGHRPTRRRAAAARRSTAGPTMRTTIVLAVRNEPGALLRVLAVFADHGLNMSTIESRPSRERAWEYVFWVDLDADRAAPAAGRRARRPPGGHDDGPGPRLVPAAGRAAERRTGPDRAGRARARSSA